jgi:hypothetical protein
MRLVGSQRRDLVVRVSLKLTREAKVARAGATLVPKHIHSERSRRVIRIDTYPQLGAVPHDTHVFYMSPHCKSLAARSLSLPDIDRLI